MGYIGIVVAYILDFVLFFLDKRKNGIYAISLAYFIGLIAGADLWTR